MKTYVGTKTVRARYDAEPSKFNPEGKPGYRVLYKDGHESWSPSEAFEGAYHIAETPIDRVILELCQVETRFFDATEFLYSDRSREVLSDEARELLTRQADAMFAYIEILQARLQLMRREQEEGRP